MKEVTQKLLRKAERAVHAAEVLLREGDADFAAGRAYYGLFYTAEALLHEKGLRSRKHSGVHAMFGEHFAKSGQLDPKFHRWLLDAFDKRTVGDYGIESVVTSEEVAQMIAQAREFLLEARRYLEEGT
jgi:uncharacterized protein (UPF0332 family)